MLGCRAAARRSPAVNHAAPPTSARTPLLYARNVPRTTTRRWTTPRWTTPRALPRPARADAALGVLVAVAGVVEQALPWPPSGARLAVVAAVLVAGAAVAWRRASPHAALGLSLVALGAAALVDSPGIVPVLATLVTVHTVQARGSRAAAGGAAVVGTAILSLADHGDSTLSLPVIVLAAATMYALATVTGLLARSRLAVLADAEDRASRAEQTREAEAGRRVAEERLRIARELHDVIGHHVAIVGIQSALADSLLEARPADARTALGHVQDASERVLDELGTLVRLLREPSDDARGPLPRLQAIPSLVEEARHAGLEVALTTTGPWPDVPDGTGLAAYRVVQESLTNARRYGDGRARVDVTTTGATLEIRTTNRVAAASMPARPSTGVGLVGLRERLTALGGTLTTTSDGVFTLAATLPVPPQHPGAPEHAAAPEAPDAPVAQAAPAPRTTEETP